MRIFVSGSDVAVRGIRAGIHRAGVIWTLFWLGWIPMGQAGGMLPAEENILITASATADRVPESFIIPGTVQARLVEVNWAGLRDAARGGNTEWRFVLFADVTLTGTVNETAVRSGREFTVAGALTGETPGTFSLTRYEGYATGEFLTETRHYELYYDANAASHAVAEINDMKAVPPLLLMDQDTRPKTSDALMQTRSLAPAADSGSVFDIMILYTPAARTAAGGHAAMYAVIDRAVDNMNRVFRRSGVSPRLRLVHKQEIAYTEIRNATGDVMDHEDRAALENSSAVKSLRDQYGADMVCFYTVGIGSGVIEWPYALTGWDHANSSYTMAHEMGHGMGCHHAVGDTWSGDPPGTQRGEGKYSYSHGWHYFKGTQRYSTIMAYPSPDNYRYSTWAVISPYYSNPFITDEGIPTGSRVNGVDEANNARTINEMAAAIANWRASKSGPPAPINVVASEMHEYADKVRVTWSPSAGATHYRVYRARYAADIPDPISDWQTATTFDDTEVPPVQPNWYSVRAAKSNTGSLPSEWSLSDSGWRNLPAPEINASGGSYSDRVHIAWDAVPGAEYYRVYRAVSETGDRQPISPWIAVTSYDDRTAQVLDMYYYWVQSSFGQGDLTSDYSEPDRGWRSIAVPAGVSASDGLFTDRVTVTWNKVEGVSYYRVYRANTQMGEKSPASDWITANSFDDRTAVPGKVYFYSVNASANASGFDATNYSKADAGWRKVAPTPTPIKIDPTPTPHFASPTPGTFVTARPTLQIITPTPTATPTATPRLAPTSTPAGRLTPTAAGEFKIPANTVEVFDHDAGSEPLTGSTDLDDLNDRRLVIRWNYEGGLPVTDWHVYVKRGDFGYFFLGRTKTGESRSLVWTNPDVNAQYQFRVWGLYQNELGQNRQIVLSQPGPLGYNLTGGSVIALRQMANPTDLAPGTAVVVDDLFHTRDLSGGQDTDTPLERALGIKFNPGEGEFINTQIFVSTNGADYVMLGQTGAVDLYYFRWDANGSFSLTPDWREGPRDGVTYWFRIFALKSAGGNVRMDTGPVRFGLAR